MSLTFVLGPSFAPLDAVRLGRLVLNVEEPQQDYFDPPDQRDQEPLVRQHEKYEAVKDADKNQQFASLLTRLLTAALIKRTRTSTQITSERATTYQLRNSGAWFQSALQEESTRQWIEQAIDQGDDVYLIVGYHTLWNAQITEVALDISEGSAQLDLPVTTALAVTGAGVGRVGLTLDPAISGSQGSGKLTQKQFMATGEQVVAIQYRKLRFRWYSSRNIDRARLGSNRWKMYWDMRGRQDEDTNDVVEIELDNDLEMEEIGKKYEIHAIAGETFMY